MAGLLILHLVAPGLTTRRLTAFNGWLRANGSTILVGVLVVVGTIMVVNGIYGLVTGKQLSRAVAPRTARQGPKGAPAVRDPGPQSSPAGDAGEAAEPQTGKGGWNQPVTFIPGVTERILTMNMPAKADVDEVTAEGQAGLALGDP